MKIPGLEEALRKLDLVDEMVPVLEEIRDNLDRLVRIQTAMLEVVPWPGTVQSQRIVKETLEEL